VIPVSSPLRDFHAPVGRLNSRGWGSGTIGQMIRALLLEELILLVVVSFDGFVYALPPRSITASETERLKPEWIAGVFTHRCGKNGISDALLEQSRQMRGMAA
jgi:hypothetical protein